jgi:hypothetical protein
MRILVTDTNSLGSLVTYLRRCGCTVDIVGFNAAEASPTPLEGVSNAHLRMQLDAYVRVWMALHPGAKAAILGRVESMPLGAPRTSGQPIDGRP